MHIVIVEDEKRLADYLTRAIKEEEYSVETFYDGKDALSYIENFHDEIDCIVLDILLPNISGLQICKRLRKKHIDIPVIMLTAKDGEKEKIEGLDAGADDYLTKPFSLSELHARIRSLLRRKTGELNHVIQLNNISIDTKSMKVYLKEKEIFLTLKEYELLKLFLTHPNQVFNREQILENIWGGNFDTFSNVVDVHVTYLRKKIHDDTEPHIIQSIRGVGYRLNA